MSKTSGVDSHKRFTKKKDSKWQNDQDSILSEIESDIESPEMRNKQVKPDSLKRDFNMALNSKSIVKENMMYTSSLAKMLPDQGHIFENSSIHSIGKKKNTDKQYLKNKDLNDQLEYGYPLKKAKSLKRETKEQHKPSQDMFYFNNNCNLNFDNTDILSSFKNSPAKLKDSMK